MLAQVQSRRPAPNRLRIAHSPQHNAAATVAASHRLLCHVHAIPRRIRHPSRPTPPSAHGHPALRVPHRHSTQPHPAIAIAIVAPAPAPAARGVRAALRAASAARFSAAALRAAAALLAALSGSAAQLRPLPLCGRRPPLFGHPLPFLIASPPPSPPTAAFAGCRLLPRLCATRTGPRWRPSRRRPQQGPPPTARPIRWRARVRPACDACEKPTSESDIRVSRGVVRAAARQPAPDLVPLDKGECSLY